MTDSTAQTAPTPGRSTPGAPVPPHDPGTRRWLPQAWDPIDSDRVRKLLDAEWERFSTWSGESGAHNARAARTLPLGVTSSLDRKSVV